MYLPLLQVILRSPLVYLPSLRMLISGLDVAGGLGGGLLIGLASSALMYMTGRMTGISGIAHSLVTARSLSSMFGWRLSYVAGLATSGTLLLLLKPSAFGGGAAAALTARPWVAVLAGLLVGVGTRLGGGCTSGHGVCGIPRLSPRSLLAVGTFMATGSVTATLVRSQNLLPHFFSAQPFVMPALVGGMPQLSLWLPTAAVIVAALALFHRSHVLHWFSAHAPGAPTHTPASGSASASHEAETSVLDHLTSFASATAFGVALGVSGMTNSNTVQSFLDFTGASGWNPTLALVMGAAVGVNALTFNAMARSARAPVMHANKPFEDIISVGACPANSKIDWRLLGGSALFG